MCPSSSWGTPGPHPPQSPAGPCPTPSEPLCARLLTRFAHRGKNPVNTDSESSPPRPPRGDRPPRRPCPWEVRAPPPLLYWGARPVPPCCSSLEGGLLCHWISVRRVFKTPVKGGDVATDVHLGGRPREGTAEMGDMSTGQGSPKTPANPQRAREARGSPRTAPGGAGPPAAGARTPRRSPRQWSLWLTPPAALCGAAAGR